MKRLWNPIRKLIKNETVFCAALLLALLSMLFVQPDAQYADYIDTDTLLLLFALMTVTAGFQRLGLFSLLGCRLLALVKTVRQMLLALIFLPFFFSMLITNDVALITFVPFGLVVLRLSGKERFGIALVVLQTLAANLGSMLTPVGNPQNLYLYARSGLPLSAFVRLMLPYTLTAALCLSAAVFFATRKDAAEKLTLFSADAGQKAAAPARLDIFRAAAYGAAFLLCLLTVADVLSPLVSACVTLILFAVLDRKTLLHVDYALLGTFAGFFVFIGNLGRLPAFRSFLFSVLDGRERLIAVLASQILSNVPAALLLSGFTEHTEALIVGVNLGGLGTLIASMASLISYKQLAREYPDKKARYLLWFTLANVGMLLLLSGTDLLIRLL